MIGSSVTVDLLL